MWAIAHKGEAKMSQYEYIQDQSDWRAEHLDTRTTCWICTEKGHYPMYNTPCPNPKAYAELVGDYPRSEYELEALLG